MHSDGCILDIYPHMIELGLDALNSQIFCMGIEKLEQFRGKITFWGEIDRQHILPEGTPEQVEEAVKSVKESLWAGGGCIAQCEFGPGGEAGKCGSGIPGLEPGVDWEREGLRNDGESYGTAGKRCN